MQKKTYTKNAKHSIPPISWLTKDNERMYIETDKDYSFSYNPEFQPKEGRPLLWAPYYNNMSTLFYSLNYCDIKVNSEFGAYGRWHFHGCILIKDVLKFYVYDLPKLRKYGALEIDEINDPEKWEEYCDKEQHLVGPFLKELNAVGTIDTTMKKPKTKIFNIDEFKELERKPLNLVIDCETDDDEDNKSFDSENGKWTRKFWKQ